MLKKTVAIVTLVSIAMLWTFLLTTAPSTAGPLGILIFFVLMYFTALGVLSFLLYGASLCLVRIAAVTHTKARFGTISFRKAYYYATVVGLAPVMFIALQSVSGVEFYQFVLIVLFVALSCFYVGKRTT